MHGELPCFRTSRLLLRPRSLADLQACLSMDRDPEVTRFIPGPWHDTVAHRAFVLDRMQRAYPNGMGYWSIIAARGFIGWVLLTPLDLHGPEIEIGWRLMRAAWGRGYATEAARPVLAHALITLGLPRVVADINPANARSLAVARKLGFVGTDPPPMTAGWIGTALPGSSVGHYRVKSLPLVRVRGNERMSLSLCGLV